jgi:hypothetical protein
MVAQFDYYTTTVILSGAVFQAERRACPERSRRDLPLHRRNAQAKVHHYQKSTIGLWRVGLASLFASNRTVFLQKFDRLPQWQRLHCVPISRHIMRPEH